MAKLTQRNAKQRIKTMAILIGYTFGAIFFGLIAAIPVLALFCMVQDMKGTH